MRGEFLTHVADLLQLRSTGGVSKSAARVC
jgi:hypothetical protein